MHEAFSDTCVSTAFNPVSSDSKFLLRILCRCAKPGSFRQGVAGHRYPRSCLRTDMGPGYVCMCISPGVP